MSTILEKEVEQKLVEMVKRNGGKCLKWVCPGWRGVPDRILLMPGGKVYFVELKRPKGGKTAATQKWWHKQLAELGFEVFQVQSLDQVLYLELYIKDGVGRRQ